MSKKEDIKITDEKEIKVFLKALKEFNKKMKEIVNVSTSLDEDDSTAKKRITYYIDYGFLAYASNKTYIPYYTEFSLKENMFNKKELTLYNNLINYYKLYNLMIEDSLELYQFLKNHKTISSINIHNDELWIYDNLIGYKIIISNDVNSTIVDYEDEVMEYELDKDEIQTFLSKNNIFTMYLNLHTERLEYIKPATDDYYHLTISLMRVIGTPTLKESVDTKISIRVFDYDESQSIFLFAIIIDNKKTTCTNYYLCIC